MLWVWLITLKSILKLIAADFTLTMKEKHVFQSEACHETVPLNYKII